MRVHEAVGSYAAVRRTLVKVATGDRWPAYPEYKDSGVEWLGEVPNHWAVLAVRRLFKIVNGATPKSGEESYWNGDIPWATPDDLGNLNGNSIIVETARYLTEEGYADCGTTLVPAGSLVLSTRAPIGHLAVAGMALCTNQGCRALVFEKDGVSNYFYYQLLAAKQELQSLGQGTTFLELGRNRLASMFLCAPPHEEQAAIASFLDRETARIDALIAKKQRLIELLQEKRTALISQAVTKGLDLGVPMKDSGVEWLGEVPAHWAVKWLGVVSDSLQTGPFGSQLHASDYVDDGTPVINPANITNGILIPDFKCSVTDEKRQELARHQLLKGDIVFGRRGEMGRCGLIGENEEGWLCGTGCLRVRLKRQAVLPEFLYAFFGFRGVSEYLSLVSVGSTMENLNTSILGRMPVLTPPLPEQRDIAVCLNHQNAKLDALRAKVEAAIDRLREYRAALISAAVTGKIDVRAIEEGREVA